MKAAAITGVALRTPLGNDLQRAADRLLAGERAACRNTRFPVDSYECQWAAPVAGEPAPTKHKRFLRRMGLFAIEAATEALAQSGLKGGPRLGLFCGYGGLRAHWNDMMAGLAGQRPDGVGAWERGLKDIHPFWMLKHLSNNAHALLAADIGARGEGVTFGGANAAAQAIASATRALAAGAVDAAVVVAYDSFLEPETLVEQAARGALVKSDAPMAPYDRGACGAIPGEAAAAIVLERDAGDRAWATIAAAAGADGNRGEPAVATIESVVRRVFAHQSIIDGAGRATPPLDDAERAAIARVTGSGARLICTVAATGQTGGAGPLVRAMLVAECLRRGTLPPIAGLRRANEGPLIPVIEHQSTSLKEAIVVHTGAPGLASAVRVEVP
jgi:3-oxoacyl-(acyl-carrier-protein) synthase